MRQIYDFTASPPPVLRESQLRRTLYAGNRRRQVLQLAASGLLLLVCIFLLGLRLAGVAPLAAALCRGYALIGLVGGAVILHVFWKKKGAERP